MDTSNRGKQATKQKEKAIKVLESMNIRQPAPKEETK